MQVIIVAILMLLAVWAQDLKAQLRHNFGSNKADSLKPDTSHITLSVYNTPEWKKVDVDFLSSYYEQDGNNSPVTGGIGTERLTDFTQKIILSVPISEKLRLNGDAGYDYYTSASTDKIDPVYSDDSQEDTRIHGNIGLAYSPDKRQTVAFRLGGSGEFDYASTQLGFNYSRLSRDENTALDMRFQAFFDQWRLIYPIELRNQGQLVTTNLRQSYNASIGVQRVLDKKTQMSAQLEATYMNGLLSTPFHRVYFQGSDVPRVEQLPGSRLKIPIGLRLNRYVNEWLIARLYYRFYVDNWGMTAHTASVELPIKLHRFLALVPTYRFHTQSAVNYFQPYGQHSPSAQYYTSDYDLSALQSHSFGLGLNYQPAGGVFRLKYSTHKEHQMVLDHIDLRYARYMRSTGLNANIISFGLGFTFH